MLAMAHGRLDVNAILSFSWIWVYKAGDLSKALGQWLSLGWQNWNLLENPVKPLLGNSHIVATAPSRKLSGTKEQSDG